MQLQNGLDQFKKENQLFCALVFSVINNFTLFIPPLIMVGFIVAGSHEKEGNGNTLLGITETWKKWTILFSSCIMFSVV